MSALDERLDFDQVADVFWCLSARRRMPQGSMRFRKFSSLDAAVRFVILDKSETRYQCVIDTDVGRYEGSEINELYDRPDFPDAAAPRDATPSRRFGMDFFAKAPKALSYDIRRDPQGTWTISSATTGRTVSINNVVMDRMSLPDAERMVDVLNSSDGPDMLAIGP